MIKTLTGVAYLSLGPASGLSTNTNEHLSASHPPSLEICVSSPLLLGRHPKHFGSIAVQKHVEKHDLASVHTAIFDRRRSLIRRLVRSARLRRGILRLHKSLVCCEPRGRHHQRWKHGQHFGQPPHIQAAGESPSQPSPRQRKRQHKVRGRGDQRDPQQRLGLRRRAAHAPRRATVGLHARARLSPRLCRRRQ